MHVALCTHYNAPTLNVKTTPTTVCSVGKSAAGTDMWALEVSDKPGVTEAEPKFKYVANMHGDETSGR